MLAGTASATVSDRFRIHSDFSRRISGGASVARRPPEPRLPN